MASFKAVIDDLNLKEIGLNGRRFTWSNEQDNPTLTRINILFCTTDWELTFPTCFLHSLPSLMSDHTPLLLQGELEHCHNQTFRFENFWVKMDGFRDLVEQVWSKPVHSLLPIKRLHTKLARVAKGLKRWCREKVGDTRLQLAIVKEVLLQLEAAQEFRTLTQQELDLRRRLKIRSTGLAAIEKSRIKQRARLTYIHSGDANTKFFHIRASTRMRKNYIHSPHTDGRVATTHNDKEKIIANYFSRHLGSHEPRSTTFSWSALGYVPRDLSALEASFTQDEIKDTINSRRRVQMASWAPSSKPIGTLSRMMSLSQ